MFWTLCISFWDLRYCGIVPNRARVSWRSGSDCEPGFPGTETTEWFLPPVPEVAVVVARKKRRRSICSVGA